jgi:hypothetical protein
MSWEDIKAKLKFYGPEDDGLAGNSMRLPGNVISRLRLMYCSSFARSVRAAAFFTMIFLSMANGEARAANGLPRHLIPVSIPSIHEGEIHTASNDRAPMAYFLDEWPADFDLTKLPSEAKDVVIAKVRATESTSSLGGREIPGLDLSRDKLFIRIKILEVRLGSAAVGEKYAVYFGESGYELMFPHTPDHLRRDYVVVMYRDSLDAKNRLIGFPASYAQWLEWQAEIFKYQRSLHHKN